MKFFYCTVCEHYHIDDSRLPCSMLGRGSRRTVIIFDPERIAKIRRKSQRMLNSREVFLQTLR
jgi:hypothetical protein